MPGLKIKISALIVIVGISSVVPTGLVLAQVRGIGPVPVEDLDLQSKADVISEGINGKKGGLLGSVEDAVDVVAEIRSGIADKACYDLVEKAGAEGQAAFLESFGKSTFTQIGGSEAEAVLNTTQAKAMQYALKCISDYLNSFPTKTSHLQAAADINREKETFSGIRDALSQRVDAMNARASSSWKDVLKAVMVRIILNLNKNLTTSMVNKMVDKYKISDYLKYGDAVASQIYSMKYINENFTGDARQQMIVRSLLQSEQLPERVKTAQAFATSKAQEYLGSACGATSTPSFNQDLTSYMNCLAAYGSVGANPNFHLSQGVDQANAAQAAGRVNASAEISQSNGFAPPRDCSGSLSVQKEIDARFDKAAKEKMVAMETVAKLKNALNVNPPRTTQEEYNKAVQALDQATANAKQLEKQSSSAIIDICEAIVSPANFVATSINNFLKQHIDQGSQMKNDNLPFYAEFLADFSTNFLTNILTGGKSTSQVLKEAGTAGLKGALEDLKPTTGSTTPGGTTPPIGTPTPRQPDIAVYALVNGDQTTQLVPNQTYTIVVDFASIAASRPMKIDIRSLGSTVVNINRNLTDAEKSSNKMQFTYTATASPLDLEINLWKAADSVSVLLIERYNKTFGVVGEVRSANIVLPRGPELSLR